jgi:ADP-heptose:LPS heptosyltransferase
MRCPEKPVDFHRERKLPMDSSVRRVLIYRLGSMGDTVVALPCFHLIARAFPQAERRLLCNFSINAHAPAAAVLENSGLVHGYIHYTTGTRKVSELLGLIWAIRRFRPDVLIYMTEMRQQKDVRRDQLFFRLAGVRHFLGLSGKEGFKKRFDPATGLYEPEFARLGRQLSALGDARTEDTENWQLHLTLAERQAATTALGALAQMPLIVCGPGTKMPAKDWGQEKWRALLARLHAAYPQYALAMVGAPAEAAAADFAADLWAGPKVNLCGQPPREMAAVMEKARVFLGPDSGPMHMAASVGTPCVIAFSARCLPGVWFPMGQHQIVYHQTDCCGCLLENCTVEARRCMTSITVEEMAAAVGRVLGNSPDSQLQFFQQALHGGR